MHAQSSLSAEELRFLDEAALYLERPSFLIKVADFVGQPAERLLKLLPPRAHAMVSQIAQAALERAFGVAVRSLSSRWPILGRWKPAAGPRLHVALAAITGGAGGLFGWPGAAVEIPITTTLMMRSIAEIARRNGSDLTDPETLMQCLAVFSYGSPKLEAMESAFLSCAWPWRPPSARRLPISRCTVPAEWRTVPLRCWCSFSTELPLDSRL